MNTTTFKIVAGIKFNKSSVVIGNGNIQQDELNKVLSSSKIFKK